MNYYFYLSTCFSMHLSILLAFTIPVLTKPHPAFALLFFWAEKKEKKATVDPNAPTIEIFVVTFDTMIASTGFAMTTTRAKKSTALK